MPDESYSWSSKDLYNTPKKKKNPYCSLSNFMLCNLWLTSSINVGVSLKFSHLKFLYLQNPQNVLALNCLNSLPSIIFSL